MKKTTITPPDWFIREGNYNALLLSREIADLKSEETRYFLPAEKMVKPETMADLEAEYRRTHPAPVSFTTNPHPLDLTESHEETE